MKIIHPIFMLAVAVACSATVSSPVSAAAPTKPAAPAPRPAVAPAPAPAPAAPAAPAPPPREREPRTGSAIARADALYEGARFSEAMGVLDRALHDGDVTGDDVIQARALRARCLVKMSRRLEAKEAFKGVLRIDRAFALDPNVVPPDEMDVFRLAAQEYDAELFAAGHRFPASIAATFGRGNCVNQDLADLASSAGVAAAPDFSEKAELGYSVRFPLRPLLSIEVEATWLRATTHDLLPADRNAHTLYTAAASVFMLDLVRTLRTSPRAHVNAFVGAGPMLAEAILEDRNSLVAGRVIPTQIVGHNQGWAFQAGLEGEALLRPRLALTAQVRARRADSGQLHWLRSDFEIYESYPVSKLGDRSIDFSGVAASIGLRAYIGY